MFTLLLFILGPALPSAVPVPVFWTNLVFFLYSLSFISISLAGYFKVGNERNLHYTLVTTAKNVNGKSRVH